jgi:DNA-directed RNA polymerase subunit M/transcription elongation factor TFIIS
MFYFFSWGSKWKYNVKEGGLRVAKLCPECGVRGTFFEVIPTKYFSIFWVPVAPTESKKPLLECPNCHERFYIQEADYSSAIKDSAKSEKKYNKVIHLPQDSIDVSIVPCDNCGQKLKVPKNDRMLRVKCPSCKNTFHFQKGEKIYKATPSDSHDRLESSKITWWQKHLYSLIGTVVILGTATLFLALFEHKPQIESPSVAPPSPTQTSIPSSPKVTNLKPPAEKPQTNSSPFPVTPVEPIEDNPNKSMPNEPTEPINPKRLPNGSSPYRTVIRSGHSTLTVDNGTDTDAFIQVIRLTGKEQLVRNFYIHSKAEWTEKSLPPGQYIIRVAFGRDWNTNFRKFNFRRLFSETDVFELSETQTEYTIINITLHKVPFGNFESHEINEEEFMRTLLTQIGSPKDQ